MTGLVAVVIKRDKYPGKNEERKKIYNVTFLFIILLLYLVLKEAKEGTCYREGKRRFQSRLK